LAEQERLEKLEEEADAAAEAAAVAAGKITTADLEVPPPVWPFDQHYKYIHPRPLRLAIYSKEYTAFCFLT